MFEVEVVNRLESLKNGMAEFGNIADDEWRTIVSQNVAAMNAAIDSVQKVNDIEFVLTGVTTSDEAMEKIKNIIFAD